MRPPSTIPGNSISRLIAGDKPVNNLEVIIQYLSSEEGAVILSDKQDEILRRLTMADDLIRSRLYDMNQVARLLVKRWKYGIATARRDISDAQYVWGTQQTRNKNYLVTLNIDRQSKTIQKLEDAGQWDLLHKYYATYNKALELLPDDKKQDTTPAAVILNVGINNYQVLTGKDPEADNIIDITKMQLGDDAEDLKALLDE